MENKTTPEWPATQSVLLGNSFHYDNGGTYKWNCHLQLANPLMAYLIDHRYNGKALLPAAAFVETAFSALQCVTEKTILTLEDMVFENAFILPERSDNQILRTTLLPECRNRIYSVLFHQFSNKNTVDRFGKIRAKGHGYAVEQPKTVESISLEEIQQRCLYQLDGSSFYRNWEQRENSLYWGPAFRGVNQLWIGDGECLARILMPELIINYTARICPHPAALDACFHPVIALLPLTWNERFVIKSIGMLEVTGTLPIISEYFSHVSATSKLINTSIIEVNVDILDSTGTLLCRVTSLRFSILSGDHMD